MQIFQSSLSKLAGQLLPPRMRSYTLMALVRAMITPVEQLRSDLLQHRNTVTYWMGITPQRCYLEKALNDNFDPDARGIYILNSEGNDIKLIHQNEALKPVIISEAECFLIHDQSAYSGGGSDFTVNVGSLPLSASDEQHLRSILNNNKLADKRYTILKQ